MSSRGEKAVLVGYLDDVDGRLPCVIQRNTRKIQRTTREVVFSPEMVTSLTTVTTSTNSESSDAEPCLSITNDMENASEIPLEETEAAYQLKKKKTTKLKSS